MAWKADDVRRYLDRVHAVHDFYFEPSLEAEREWLEKFLKDPDGNDWIDDLVKVRKGEREESPML